MSDDVFKIESGIPVPPGNGGKRGRRFKYPFREMKPGDSFVAPLIVRMAASSYKLRYRGFDYRTETLGDGTCRVWCISQESRKD